MARIRMYNMIILCVTCRRRRAELDAQPMRSAAERTNTFLILPHRLLVVAKPIRPADCRKTGSYKNQKCSPQNTHKQNVQHEGQGRTGWVRHPVSNPQQRTQVETSMCLQPRTGWVYTQSNPRMTYGQNFMCRLTSPTFSLQDIIKYA